MDLSLTQEHEMVAKMVRDFAEKEVAPVIKEHDREQKHIPWIFKRLGELGILGICLPVKLGGAGMDYISLGLACEELERVDTSLRVILSVHVGLNSLALFQWGSEEQKEKYLTLQAKGEKIATYALTEPGAGSDAAAIRTTAKRRGDKYILNGEKMWISLADVADQFLILAKTEPEKSHKGMTAFIVERGFPGVTTGTIHGKLGVRAGNTGFIALQDAQVRETFGKKIAEHQLVQEMMGKMARDYDVARLLWLRAGWLKNVGRRNTRETSQAKWFATDASFAAAADAVQIHGAYGYSDEYDVERYLRNSKGAVIYEGTSQIHTLMQAGYALGQRQDRPLRRELPAYDPEVWQG
jgi:alkylation response protein AidB-like acyl-CoA dehydrogenase